MASDKVHNFNESFRNLFFHETLIIFSKSKLVIAWYKLYNFKQNKFNLIFQQFETLQSLNCLQKNLIIIVVLSEQFSHVAFLILCQIKISLYQILHFFAIDSLFCTRLFRRQLTANYWAFCHKRCFFYFTKPLNHDFNVVVDNFILKTCIFSAPLIPSLYPLMILENHEICSPFWFKQRVFVTKIRACRASFFSSLVRKTKFLGLIFLFFRK